MGFANQGVWGMGYCGPMGYGMQFPANQVGGQLRLWVIRGYGLSGVWVMRGSTVLAPVVDAEAYHCQEPTAGVRREYSGGELASGGGAGSRAHAD